DRVGLRAGPRRRALRGAAGRLAAARRRADRHRARHAQHGRAAAADLRGRAAAPGRGRGGRLRPQLRGVRRRLRCGRAGLRDRPGARGGGGVPAPAGGHRRGAEGPDRPMNVTGVALVAALVAGFGGGVAGLVVPRTVRPVVVGACVAAAGALATLAGVAAMAGVAWSAALPWLLPLTGVELAVDPLGGVFLAVTGAVAVAAGVYGIGYARGGLDGRAVQAALPVFVASLLLVPAAGSIGTLLVCWELMALASLLLVLAEHGKRAE